MSITTYITGWLTKKTLSTLAWIAIPVFLLYQCNRGCGSEPQPVSSAFDYTAIAVSLNKVDTMNTPCRYFLKYLYSNSRTRLILW